MVQSQLIDICLNCSSVLYEPCQRRPNIALHNGQTHLWLVISNVFIGFASGIPLIKAGLLRQSPAGYPVVPHASGLHVHRGGRIRESFGMVYSTHRLQVWRCLALSRHDVSSAPTIETHLVMMVM